jgi:hypothetical protein
MVLTVLRRTLEEIDFLFASESWFVWNEEAEFEKRVVEFNNHIALNNRMANDIEHLKDVDAKPHIEHI